MSLTTLNKPVLPVVAAKKAYRLGYLDGIRGLTSLYVCIYHAFVVSAALPSTSDNAILKIFSSLKGQFLQAIFFRYGHQAVVIFIIISGYSLMLPVIRAGTKSLPGGIAQYWRRRAYRILPPYYAALGFSIILLLIVPGFGDKSGTVWDQALPGLNLEAIGSHLLLIHNWVPQMSLRINPPLWSIAVEWQLYFLFVFGLLPLWFKLGKVAVVGTSFAISLGFYFWLSDAHYLIYPWFLGLFCLGMFAATVNFQHRQGQETTGPEAEREEVISANRDWTASVPWWLVGFIGLALFGVIALLDFDFWSGLGKWPILTQLITFVRGDVEWLRDILVGIATTGFLIYYTEQSLEGRSSRVLRMLESRAAVRLGLFSYSLYLIHDPTLALLGFFCRKLQLAGLASDLIIIGAGIPLCISVAYGFYCLVEGPSLQRAKRA